MQGREGGEGDRSAAGEGQRAHGVTGTPGELYELGGRLLERGDARQAAEVFAAAVEQLDTPLDAERGTAEEAVAHGRAAPATDGPADAVRGQLLAGLGIALLEEAVAAFGEAAASGDADVRPLAVELLARTLPLRDRDDEAAQAWRRGLEDRDPEVAAAVRARLRRNAGGTADDGTVAARFWWDGFLESAVCHGTLPLLANELFGAIDHLYAMVAVPYARGGARARELRDAVAAAVRLPSGYAWGAELQQSFRGRLADAVGADTDVLPPDWPDG